jgi:hypothetical protein
LLSDLKDWDRSDRLNSTSWSGEGYSSVSLYYAGQGEKADRLIGQLEQGKKVSREDVDEASDAEAIKWGGFLVQPSAPRMCDAVYEKGYPWRPRDSHQPAE